PLLDGLERDAAPFDLQGCLSPQRVYLEGEDPGIFEKLYARVNRMPALKRFEGWDELKTELHSLQPYLSTVGFAGPLNRMEERRAELEKLGISRVCVVGEMQQPPLSWRNGGISLVEALTA